VRYSARIAGLVAAAAHLAGCSALQTADVELPLRDSFSTDDCSWPQESEQKVGFRCTGEHDYSIVVERPGRPVLTSVSFGPSVPALSFQATARAKSPVPRAAERAVAYGLGCWNDDHTDGYVFLVNRAGAAVIGRFVEGVAGWARLDEREGVFPTRTAARRSATLRADCLGTETETKLVFTVNGYVLLVAEHRRAQPKFSRIGFYAFTESQRVDFRFDDVSAEELSGAALDVALKLEER
jgi:hypothetical protein